MNCKLQDGTAMAHSAVLRAVSKPFRQMLTGEMSEGTATAAFWGKEARTLRKRCKRSVSMCTKLAKSTTIQNCFYLLASFGWICERLPLPKRHDN